MSNNFAYMEIRKYFHLLCNYLQTYRIIRIFPTSPTTPKSNPSKSFSLQTVELLHPAIHIDKPKQLTFLDTVEMGLTTDMQTYKSPKLVQPLLLKMFYCILTTHLFFYIYILFFFCIYALFFFLFLFTIYVILMFDIYALFFLCFHIHLPLLLQI